MYGGRGATLNQRHAALAYRSRMWPSPHRCCWLVAGCRGKVKPSNWEVYSLVAFLQQQQHSVQHFPNSSLLYHLYRLRYACKPVYSLHNPGSARSSSFTATQPWMNWGWSRYDRLAPLYIGRRVLPCSPHTHSSALPNT